MYFFFLLFLTKPLRCWYHGFGGVGGGDLQGAIEISCLFINLSIYLFIFKASAYLLWSLQSSLTSKALAYISTLSGQGLTCEPFHSPFPKVFFANDQV